MNKRAFTHPSTAGQRAGWGLLASGAPLAPLPISFSPRNSLGSRLLTKSLPKCLGGRGAQRRAQPQQGPQTLEPHWNPPEAGPAMEKHEECDNSGPGPLRWAGRRSRTSRAHAHPEARPVHPALCSASHAALLCCLDIRDQMKVHTAGSKQHPTASGTFWNGTPHFSVAPRAQSSTAWSSALT